MSELIESIRNLSFSYIKQHYEKIFKKKTKTILNSEEIAVFHLSFMIKKKDNMIDFIKKNFEC